MKDVAIKVIVQAAPDIADYTKRHGEPLVMDYTEAYLVVSIGEKSTKLRLADLLAAVKALEATQPGL